MVIAKKGRQENPAAGISRLIVSMIMIFTALPTQVFGSARCWRMDDKPASDLKRLLVFKQAWEDVCQ